jgi:hypothetical protein
MTTRLRDGFYTNRLAIRIESGLGGGAGDN